jgi:hypothetical protein
MKVNDILNAPQLRPLKFTAREVPHAVIETNENCNRHCVTCYKRGRSLVKSLPCIRSEIDLAMSLRKLETISLLGGEPTLHPELPAIIRYIKSRGLVCQILSNGLRFTEPAGSQLLQELILAGLDRLVLHVDEGQGMGAEEMEQMRERLASLCESCALLFGIAVTLTREHPDVIPAIMKRYARFRYFDGILATVASRIDRVVSGLDATDGSPDVSAVYKSIHKGLGVLPSSYVPSNLDDRDVRWLTYFYYFNAATGVAFSVSPWFSRVMRNWYRVLVGRHLFAATMNPGLALPWFVFTITLELIKAPVRITELFRLLKNSGGATRVRFHYIVIQLAPEYNHLAGRVEFCFHCPDATVRNGVLAPVCIADWLTPPGTACDPLASAIYAHLAEA